jgi:hypothetical protein
VDLREIGCEDVEGLIWLKIWFSCGQKCCKYGVYYVNCNVVLSLVTFMIFKFSVPRSVLVSCCQKYLG